MPSAMFIAYSENLRRIRLAEFVDDHLQSQCSWRRKIRYSITESTRSEVRGQLHILRMKKDRSD